MLGDRAYMYRSSFGAQWWKSATVGVLIANLIVFVFQCVNRVYLHLPFEFYCALEPNGLAKGYVWQLLTFQFLHAGTWHFAINSLMLFMFGRIVEDAIGRARFLEVYFAGGFAGGLLQAALGLAAPQYFGGSVVGASAGIFGLIAVFSLLDPDRPILIWFVLPIPAKFFLGFAGAVALFFVLVPVEPGVAHAAHLGGMLGGIGYVYGFLRRDRRLLAWPRRKPAAPSRELVNAHASKRSLWQRAKAVPTDDLPPSEFISREVDPILDKISAHGIQSLTPRERQILEAARKRMARR